MPDTANIFAKHLVRVMKENMQDGRELIALVPIPTTKNHARKRGYNPSELLCNAICTAEPDIFVTYKSVLLRVGHIPQSKLKTRSGRIKNMQNSYSVRNAERLNGKSVILIDDVVTTCATLREAMHTIEKHSHPKSINAYAIAYQELHSGRQR
jgi:competence protein ComFC